MSISTNKYINTKNINDSDSESDTKQINPESEIDISKYEDKDFHDVFNQQDEFYHILLNEYKSKKKYYMDSSDAIIEELSDRITTYNSLIEDSDDFQEKADAKHDLNIILESLNIIAEKEVERISKILLSTKDKEDKEDLPDVIDLFKTHSDILMKIISYRVIV